MKKLGLWMLAAILLCGSVVTFVACRGNSLEDIIGNSDNTVPADLIKELLGALDDNAEITFDIKYNGNEWHPVLKKDGDVFVLQNPSDNPDIPSSSYHLNPTLTYDVATKHIVLSVVDSYSSAPTPYIGVIFDVEKNTYAVVNYNVNIDFLGITIKNNEGKNVEKIKNACPEKVTIKKGENELFYVYYATGDTWENVLARYLEANPNYILFINGSGTDKVKVNRGNPYFMYEGTNQTTYGEKVGEYDNEVIDTYELNNDDLIS